MSLYYEEQIQFKDRNGKEVRFNGYDALLIKGLQDIEDPVTKAALIKLSYDDTEKIQSYLKGLICEEFLQKTSLKYLDKCEGTPFKLQDLLDINDITPTLKTLRSQARKRTLDIRKAQVILMIIDDELIEA